jgi:hypothetical protein
VLEEHDGDSTLGSASASLRAGPKTSENLGFGNCHECHRRRLTYIIGELAPLYQGFENSYPPRDGYRVRPNDTPSTLQRVFTCPKSSHKLVTSEHHACNTRALTSFRNFISPVTNMNCDDIDVLTPAQFYASSAPVVNVLPNPDIQTLRRSTRARPSLGVAMKKTQPRKRTLSASALQNSTPAHALKKTKLDEKKVVRVFCR